jgi:hypothetical protein
VLARRKMSGRFRRRAQWIVDMEPIALNTAGGFLRCRSSRWGVVYRLTTSHQYINIQTAILTSQQDRRYCILTSVYPIPASSYRIHVYEYNA